MSNFSDSAKARLDKRHGKSVDESDPDFEFNSEPPPVTQPTNAPFEGDADESA